MKPREVSEKSDTSRGYQHEGNKVPFALFTESVIRKVSYRMSFIKIVCAFSGFSSLQ